MRGSNQRRLRSEITAKVSSDDDEDVGTAARTRPFSFDEIMLKRKNRKVLEYSNDVGSEVEKVLSKEATRYGSGRSALENCNIQSKDTVHNDANMKINDTRASYPKKEEKAPKRETDNAKSKDKDLHGLEAKLLQKSEKHTHHKIVEKTGKDVHHRSNEKMEKVVHYRSPERIEKDTHHRSGEKLTKGVHHRSSDKSEKHTHHRSSEKDARHQSNETIGKDVSYRASHRTERDASRKSKQNSEKDVLYKSLGHGDYDRTNVHERSRNKSEYDYEKRHHRDNLTSKNKNIDTDVTVEREYKRKDRNGDDVQHVDKHAVKKHDSGKRLVSEVPERKERKMESSDSRHEKERLKRRRSKSPKHTKERGRRSASLSPKAQKYSSSRGDELHLDKDRSKHQTDADRSKTSNGSASLYHRHGGSSSGLGGYSPRKRKSDAAVRTPSPLKRSPEKRNAGWDHHPSGTTSTPSSVPSAPQILVQAKPSILVESAGVILASLNASNSLSSLPSSHLLAAKNASMDTIQLTQATRPLRRLYVDNVPPSASEKDIMECFNNFLLCSGVNRIQGTKPCISCMIHKEKGQALLEFLTPEDASAALAFDRRSFSGSSLKIRRPKDFVELANDFPERSKAGADAVSDIVKDSPHKIFVGGISDALSSEMLLQIVRAFGPLKAFRFEIDANLREPCAFLEYMDQSVTLKACAALNGMKLGGRVLTVAQAFPDASFVETYEDLPSYEIPQHVKALLEKPTEVIKIKNAVDPLAISLLSELEVEEILEDVRQECTRFGSVKSINIVKAVEAVIPETQKATEVAASSLTSKETDISEQTLKTELDVFPEVSASSPRIIDEKTGISIGESNRIPKEEQQEDALAADQTTGMGTVVEEFDKADSTPKPIKSEDEETETLREEISRETEKDVESEFCKNEVPEDVGKNNGKEIPISNNDPSPEVEVKEVSEVDEKVTADLIFEPGCVFVEFRRIEASCLAAHCLHGRLFDGRTVTVQYVPHDVYRTRFPK